MLKAFYFRTEISPRHVAPMPLVSKNPVNRIVKTSGWELDRLLEETRDLFKLVCSDISIQAISWSLRTYSRPPASAGLFQVLPLSTGNRSSNWWD